MMYDYKGYKYELISRDGEWITALYYVSIQKRKLFSRKAVTKWKKIDHDLFHKVGLGTTSEEIAIKAHAKAQEAIDKRIEELRLRALLEEPKLEFVNRVMK